MPAVVADADTHHWKSDYRDFVEFFMGRVVDGVKR
jgi:hypothetical protein